MNTFFFWHLTFAHFLTDYPLQTDKLFYKKTQDFLGILIHGTLLFLSMFILSLPYSFNGYVLITVFLLTVFHIFQDRLKVRISYSEKKGENLFFYVGDQILHIFIIFLFTKYVPLPEAEGTGLWFDDFTFKFLTFLIIVTYSYWIFIYSIECTFFKINLLSQGKFKYWEFIERAVSFVLFLFNFYLSFIAFISPILLFFYEKENKKLRLWRSIFGIILSILTAFIFKEVVI